MCHNVLNTLFRNLSSVERARGAQSNGILEKNYSLTILRETAKLFFLLFDFLKSLAMDVLSREFVVATLVSTSR